MHSNPETLPVAVRIVLVATSHPGNIGATARAMKTMGLADLALVAPKHFPSDDATARAAGADDVLESARVCATLPDAVADCGLVYGASARLRTVQVPVVDPRECAAAVVRAASVGEGARAAAEAPAANRAAIVFGNEQSGLSNAELARCGALVHVPTNPAFSSLNLGMAVQVICYELRMAWLEAAARSTVSQPRETRLATAEELEHFHEHLETLLTDTGFLHPNHQKQIKLKLRRVFHRAELDHNEISILRGMLTSIGKAIGRGGEP
jgi:TrmH family RNA methyltransferase